MSIDQESEQGKEDESTVIPKDKIAEILAERTKYFNESKAESQGEKDKVKEIIAKREEEYKASRGGTPKMSLDNQLTIEEKIENLKQ